jgi:hypothetical protein
VVKVQIDKRGHKVTLWEFVRRRLRRLDIFLLPLQRKLVCLQLLTVSNVTYWMHVPVLISFLPVAHPVLDSPRRIWLTEVFSLIEHTLNQIEVTEWRISDSVTIMNRIGDVPGFSKVSPGRWV